MTVNRLKQAAALLKKHKVDVLLVSKLSNIRYLSGYSGSNGLLVISAGRTYFLTDFRYAVQARKEVKHCQVVIAERELLGELVHLPCFRDGVRVGFEAPVMTVRTANKIAELLPQVKLVPLENVIEALTVVKDAGEINRIRRAARLADAAFGEVVKMIKPGVREKDIALELSVRMIRLGADGPAFDFIVASGQRSSMPHGRASSRRIRKGDLITIDFGCFYDGYACDMTRTVVLGKATPKQKKIYQLVLSAQQAAIEAVRPQMPAKELDRVARDIISKEGYGDYFGHGLGHGIGLEVHDGPQLNPRSQDVLMAGNVITIEPGVYIPNWGGVRIEDDVLVTKTGAKLLTKTSRELLEI